MSSAETEAAVLQCPACRSPLRVTRPTDMLEEKCPVCRAEVTLRMYPRLFHDYEVAEESFPASEGEATCSFFPELRAEKVCEECGCFLSSRAAVKWAGRDLCLPCLHRLREVERSPDYIGRVKLHDRRALALVTWLAPFSLFTAPVALYLLFRHRSPTGTFIQRGGAIWWVTLILSIGWLAAWIVLMVAWAALIRDGFV